MEATEQVPEAGTENKVIDTQIDAVMSKAKSKPLTKGRTISAILVGFLGAVIGAVAWWQITALTGYQFGLFAMFSGLAVGYGMKFILKQNTAKWLGVIAGLLSLFGLLLGHFLLWGSITSDDLRAEMYVVEGKKIEDIVAMSDDEVYATYPFSEYMSEDLFGANGAEFPFLSWVFYLLAIYSGSNAVYNRKENRQKKNNTAL
jgi:hypothetical protein